MHELGRFIQDLMDAEGMTRPELERRSGLSRQHIAKLLTNKSLVRLPHRSTFDALAKAFPVVGDLPFITKAAEAIGVPVDRLTMVEPDYDSLSNEALLGILARRLERGGSVVGAEAQKAPGPGRPGNSGGELSRRRDQGAMPPIDLLAADHQDGPSGYEKQAVDQDGAETGSQDNGGMDPA